VRLSELGAWVKESAAAGAIACHRVVDAGDGPPRGGRELLKGPCLVLVIE
jgi:hypothetical protein